MVKFCGFGLRTPEWNHILLEAIRNVGKLPINGTLAKHRARGGPPQVARSIGIVYTAVYDAWSAYDDVANPVHRTTGRKPAGQRNEANKRKAISQAAYRAIVDQFPPDIYEADFKVRYQAMLADQLALDGITIGGPTPAPVDVGNQAADDVLVCNGQVKPDTFSDSLPIKIPLILQRGLIT